MARNNWISSLKQKWENIWYVPVNDPDGNPLSTTATYNRGQGGSKLADKNLSNILAPINVPRIRQDVQNWRASISEAERMILPFRYLMQQIYLDTALDPQIAACVDRRKNLTLLRKFNVVKKDGSVSEEWTAYLNKEWMKQFMSFTWDAIAYGYTLISMGDIVNNDFPGVTIIRRANISPDRLNVSPVPYDPAGVLFENEPYRDFHIWVDTPNEHGVSNCGYGLYYVLTPLSIYNKNNLAFNIQYNELFGMPFRQLKSQKKDVEERNTAQAAMDNMGSKGYIITDLDDELIFHQVGKGNGAVAYANLEDRLNKMISKLILGHADAMDSTPGKLAGSQGGDISPQATALANIQSKDGDFIAYNINEKLIPLLRRNGINFPMDMKFAWCNDAEDKEAQATQNEQNKVVAEYLEKLAGIGYSISVEELDRLTGLKFTKEEIVEEKSENTDIKNLLQNSADILNETPDDMHYGCRCEIDVINQLWVTVDTACNTCKDAQAEYNSYIKVGDIENATKIFQRHTGK